MKKKLFNYLDKKHEQHPFHIVDPSPWPIMTSMALWSTALGFIMYFNYFNNGSFHLLFGIFSVAFCLTGWFLDVIREATFQGFHTYKVQQNVYLGMLLFIVSEIMFFFSFFWGFFHFSLSPSIWIGGIWPPKGIVPINPLSLPLLNTVLLLTSGIYITIGHHSLKLGRRNATTYAILATIAHGVIFSGIQLYEYNTAPFSINDSVYGSIFYMTTGFHGIHVLVGTIFLIVCLIRHLDYQFFIKHHVGFVCAIWYWHFVDVVWIFLYLCVYIWGS
jgi:cytochrome c oxidase subunit 3